MIYKNIVTGAIIDSPCLISGGDWEEVEDTTTEEVEIEEVEEATEEAKEPKKGKKSNKK
jgi:hypothetical protein